MGKRAAACHVALPYYRDCNEGAAWSLCTSVRESMEACEGQGITNMSCQIRLLWLSAVTELGTQLSEWNPGLSW